MSRFRAALAWLCGGHAVVAGCCWLLLQIPEANAWMLAASLAVAVAAVWVAGVVEMTGVLALGISGPMSAALKTSIRRAGLIVFPLAVFAGAWFPAGAAAEWFARNAGQIDAWIIVKIGWTRTAWIHGGLAWAFAFVRYGIGTSLAVALLGALAADGLRGFASRWVQSGFAWKRLLTISLALLAGIWLPWQLAYWRPASLPPTWVQPAFAASKLFAWYVAGNLAWAVVLRTAPRRP